jgi:hypothetical protein
MKKIILVAVAILAIILLAQNCNSYQYHKLEGEYSVLKKNLEKQSEEITVLRGKIKTQKDSLNKEIAKRTMQNTALKTKNETINANVATLKNKLKLPPSVTDLESSLRFFNERYKTDLNTIIDNKIALFEYTALDVATELEEGDIHIELNEEYQEKIQNQDTIISNLEKDKLDLKTQNDSQEELAKLNEIYKSQANENIFNLEKQNKKLKTKTWLTKALIPVAAFGGYYFGKKL